MRFTTRPRGIMVYLRSFKVDEYMVVFMDGVRIRMGFAAPALEVFAAHETAVNIEIHCRHRAYFLKVKVKENSIYLQVLSMLAS